MIRIERLDGKADLSEAFRIREEVFMKEQQVSRPDEFDGFDEESVHYLVSVDGKPCGTARWRRTEEGIKLERFAVLPEFRGRGIASRLVGIAVRDISRMVPMTRIYLHAQEDVIGLYAKHGFMEVGDRFVECDIVHQTMEQHVDGSRGI